MSTQRFLAKNSLIVAVFLTASALLGFFRESAIAYKYGASAITDAYLIAMIIPNLFIGLINTSITKTYITVYAGNLAQGKIEAGWRTTNILLSYLVIGLVLLTVASLAGANWLVQLLAPSYAGEQLELTVQLTRILLPGLIFGGLMGVLIGINNTHHSFTAPSLVGVISNLIIIASIFILGSQWGIYGLAVGVLIGFIAQLLIQLPSAHKHGFRFKFMLDRHDPGLREIMVLVTPFIFSSAASQVNLIVDRTLATGLAEGTVAALNFASKLAFLPGSIFIGAVGMVSYPIVIKAAAQLDWAGVIDGLKRAVRLLMILLLPSAIGIYVLRYPFVQLIFEHGEFTARDTVITADTITYFLGAMVFNGMVVMLVYVYYALKKMVIPVITGIAAVAVNIGLSLWLIKPMQQEGLALANSLAATVNAILLVGGLFLILRLHQKTVIPVREQITFFLKLGLASVVMGIAIWLFREMSGSYVDGRRGAAVQSSVGIIIGCVVYGGVAYLLNIEEVRKGTKLVVRKMWGWRG